jgi:Na+/proline symporter
MKRVVSVFGLTFSVALVVGVAVTLLWSLIGGAATVDWGSAFRLALVLAFVLAVLEGRKGV